MNRVAGCYMGNEWVLPPGMNLRLAGNDDEEFLLSLFFSTRPELAFLPLPPAQLTLLMRQQYELQQRDYTNRYPHAEHWIITMDSKSVGKIMFERSTSALHLIDFIITPDWRNRGIGSTILVALKACIDANAGVLSLSVEHHNTHAKRLYQRLGFIKKQAFETHELLVWSSTNQTR